MKGIYCAGDQGSVVVDILRSDTHDEELLFVDDDESRHGSSVCGVPVVGDLSDVSEPAATDWLIAFGKQGGRLALAERVSETGAAFFNAVHPSSTLSARTELGVGITVNANSYIGPGATVGDHVLVDSCVNVSHDVRLAEGATVTPNAALAGDVKVGVDAYVGPGATVLRGRTVGAGAVVGGGAVVTEDVPADSTVVGVPASETDP